MVNSMGILGIIVGFYTSSSTHAQLISFQGGLVIDHFPPMCLIMFNSGQGPIFGSWKGDHF
jgi:hypothetical protein